MIPVIPPPEFWVPWLKERDIPIRLVHFCMYIFSKGGAVTGVAPPLKPNQDAESHLFTFYDLGKGGDAPLPIAEVNRTDLQKFMLCLPPGTGSQSFSFDAEHNLQTVVIQMTLPDQAIVERVMDTNITIREESSSLLDDLATDLSDLKRQEDHLFNETFKTMSEEERAALLTGNDLETDDRYDPLGYDPYDTMD